MFFNGTAQQIVCYTAVFSVVTQRSFPLKIIFFFSCLIPFFLAGDNLPLLAAMAAMTALTMFGVAFMAFKKR